MTEMVSTIYSLFIFSHSYTKFWNIVSNFFTVSFIITYIILPSGVEIRVYFQGLVYEGKQRCEENDY